MSDYESTARALALPLNDDLALSPVTTNTTAPPWHRRGPSYGRPAPPQSTAARYRARLLESASKLHRRGLAVYVRLTPLQRVLLAVAVLIALSLGILFLIFNESIFAALAPAAKRWHDVRGGWLVLFALTFLVSFPPLIGYSTCLTVAGFVYGFPNGWFIVAPATILGSTASFLASRTLLRRYTAPLARDPRFAAFAATLAHDGLILLVMLRLCPLPYSLSNGAIASFPAVSPARFALATALVTPKLLLHVFIGARLAALAGGEMDGPTRLINYAGIAFGVVVGAVTGWLIYRQTKARAKVLEEEAATALAEEEARGGRVRRAPHVRGYSDEDVDVEIDGLDFESSGQRSKVLTDEIGLRGAPAWRFGGRDAAAVQAGLGDEMELDLDLDLEDGLDEDGRVLEDGYRDAFSDDDDDEEEDNEERDGESRGDGGVKGRR